MSTIPEILIDAMSGLQLTMQFVAALLVFLSALKARSWRPDRRLNSFRMPWNSWVIATSLMVFRRVTALLLTVETGGGLIFDIDRAVLPLIISLFWAWSFARLYSQVR